MIVWSNAFSSLVKGRLRMVSARNRKGAKGKRLPPRVSSATGGPMPGVDVTDSSALQEMDDLEYIERMKRFK
jgi:hypothetical protein